MVLLLAAGIPSATAQAFTVGVALDFATGLGPGSIATGDLNGDGKPDLVATNFSANLDLLDVSGRSVVRREVGSLGAEWHTVQLSAGRRLAAGIYVVRLTQGANQRTLRAAVIE